MKKGEVWWADLPAPAGRRPVLLLSRDEAYRFRSFITVAPLTTRARGIPSEVLLGAADGVPKPCVVNLDTLNTIPKRILDKPILALTPEKMAAVHAALAFALDLP